MVIITGTMISLTVYYEDLGEEGRAEELRERLIIMLNHLTTTKDDARRIHSTRNFIARANGDEDNDKDELYNNQLVEN
jgi:hypothetical protein